MDGRQPQPQQRTPSFCVDVPAWSPAGAGLGMSSPPPPPVSGQIGDGGDCWATYAVAQRHSKKQEDKFMVKVLSTGGTPSWADFCCAVLDGHNGRRAAETCASRLPTIVSEELARLCAASGVTYDAHADSASPNWHPQLETAISAAFIRLDSEIKSVVPDGTTASFLLLKRAADGGVGVKVAWVGDSRAVLARYTDGAKTVVQALTRDHKASDVMEAARIEAFYAALARRPSSARSQGSDSEDGSYHGANAALAELRDSSQVLTDEMLGKSKKGAAPAVAPSSPSPGSSHEGSRSASYVDLNSRTSHGGNSMEEEVGPAFANLEEFNPSRLGMNVSKDSSGGLIITVPPKRGQGDGTNSRGNSMHGSACTPENSRHGPSDLTDMRAQLAKPQAPPPSPKPAAGGKPPPGKASVLPPAVLKATEAAAAAAAQRDRRSFVARLRDPETGAMSNLRLFGGNVGSSTAMTRSIGDANAARCCIAEPEFTTVLIPPTQRARIIVASDGLWDVYANEEAEQLSRGSRMDAPKCTTDCAVMMAARAQEDRAFDGLAADDITALVVDIRRGPLPAPGEGGGCCVVM